MTSYRSVYLLQTRIILVGFCILDQREAIKMIKNNFIENFYQTFLQYSGMGIWHFFTG